LGSLKPAELAGYDGRSAISAALDQILRAATIPRRSASSKTPSQHFAHLSNVASNDALVRLSNDLQTLSSKVDQLARSESQSDSFAILEQRIAALTSTLESREPPVVSESSEHLEIALRALSDRLDRMPVGNDNASAFAHLEQRVSYLLERLSVHRSPHRQSRTGRGRVA
jgi:localization factor PodJL